MSFIQCSGCHRHFGNRGYSLHIAKTQNLRCQLAKVAPRAPRAPQIPPSTLTSLDLFSDDTGDTDEDDMSNDSDDSDDLINNAAAKDADIFESLGESDRPAVAIPEQAASGSDEEPVSMPPLDQDIQFEAANSDSSPLVVIDPFPHGSPGAPTSQGSYLDDTDREASDGFIWAPFDSQCDWEVAHWAKMRGPTSSATADLLAIPEV
jgi:hypothetical protein